MLSDGQLKSFVTANKRIKSDNSLQMLTANCIESQLHLICKMSSYCSTEIPKSGSCTKWLNSKANRLISMMILTKLGVEKCVQKNLEKLGFEF